MNRGMPSQWWEHLAPIHLSDSEPSADGKKRTWVMLMPQGKYHIERYGKTLDFSEAELRKYKASFDANARGIEVSVDIDHRAPRQNDTRAAGWLERVELGQNIGKAPGLWALVRWTPLGLTEVESEQYRYISAEIEPDDWRNEITGKTHNHVLFGTTLTNRPVMKNMPALALAEVSTRAWGDVDKSTLPDSAFLDPTNRRLPVYEGTGPMVDGKYTKRGKLNIHGVEAALGAVHGAHKGTPMTGLPAGIVAKLQAWRDKYGGGGSDAGNGDSGDTQASERGSAGRGKNMAVDDATSEWMDDGEDDAASEELADTPEEENPSEGYAEDDSDSYAENDGDGPDSEGAGDLDAMDGGDMNTHMAGTTDGHAHGRYGQHSHDGDADHSEAPLKRGKGKQMAEGARGSGGALTLAEAKRLIEERDEELAELRARDRERSVSALLSGWEAGKQQFSEQKAGRTTKPNGDAAKPNGALGKPVKVQLSRVALSEAKRLMLSEEFGEVSEEMQKQIGRCIELAAIGAVDLSVRGGSNDTDRQKTTKLKLVPARENATAQTWATLEEEIKQLAEEKGIDYEGLIETKAAPPSPQLAAANKTYDRLMREATRRMSEGA